MNVEILMPKMGESITEGRILKWLKKPGDSVDRDETILEIATDKVDTEVPSPSAGVIVQLLAAEGDTVEVGKVIAYVETDASAAVVKDTPPAAQAATQPAEVAAPPQPAVFTPQEEVPISHPVSEGKRFYSPVVMRIAAEQGIGMNELEAIRGTGANGRVTKADLLAYAESRVISPATASQPASAPYVSAVPAPAAAASPVRSGAVDVIPMDNMQRLMAEHMVRSKQISPHVALVADVDMTRVVKFRDRHAEQFKQREGISLTFMPFLAQATILALKDFPFVNASIEGTNILLKRNINLGIAVAMDGGGLIVPVIKHADTLNHVGLARGIADVAFRARKKKLQPDEIQDGTFTITNFGVFGSTFGLPIINQPQVAILGVGALQKKPVVIEVDGADTIAIRSIMQVSLSFDHRLVDGAMGGQFLERVKKYLEEFSADAI
jgi:2-oxoglutarate dehydrogenase E2 component (dihydrolipoamide succinyltransferase)